MLLRELFVNPKKILKEGGNIWPESEHFDQAIAAHLAAETNKYLAGAHTKAHLIGSAATPTPGKMSGDLDVMVDLDNIMRLIKTDDAKQARIGLEKFLQDQGLQTRRTGVTVHILLPFKGRFYQVDIKAVKNAERVSLFHTHNIPANSPYKGVHKQMMMNALASSQGMLWSPDEGLYARDQAGKKAHLLSDDLDKIAKLLIGPNAKAQDLGSVESILDAIPDPARKKQIFDLASGGASWQKVSAPHPVSEDAKPTVGRKYQHIEDLVFTNGSKGGLHAIERLRHMGTASGSIELKWDGSPVVYWGKDSHGNFHLFPKNAWEYVKRGAMQTKNGVSTMMNSAQDIESFILNTGEAVKGDKQRTKFAKQLASLWPYFEKVSPDSGFIEGGILFSPLKPARMNQQTRDWEFTPNITTFHVPVDSELGQRIRQAHVMIAATGYYRDIGAQEERLPDADQLSTSDVIVQGTTYVQEAPGTDEAGLEEVSAFIQQNAQVIDSFVAGQPGLSKPGDILYKFYNQNLRIAGTKAKFVEWVKTNVSAGQAQKVLSHPGLNTILTAVEMLTNEKMKIIASLSKGTHGGIRQTKPEGYVQAHPGVPFKHDLPGQFVKTIDQANWAPRKD